ncbi:MAG: Fis family transcriptional regulator [Gammaproteobacteria bacterium]|jgi:DNA-binding protein Fis|nr:Fis family transcriptional regulator [Gammaproteobacteria bacterium]
MNNELPVNTTTNIQAQVPLRNVVEEMLHTYFTSLDPESPPPNLYDFIIKEVEIPLLKKALVFANGNQSKAASILGISRNTLRRKMAHYKLTQLEAEELET